MLLHPGVVQAASSVVAEQSAEQAGASTLGGLVHKAMSFVLHLDKHMVDLVAQYGSVTYAIVFAIVFAETGLVVTPFLPGDSLLFATGALAGLGKLNVLVLLGLYTVAATIGDAVNYSGTMEYSVL